MIYVTNQVHYNIFSLYSRMSIKKPLPGLVTIKSPLQRHARQKYNKSPGFMDSYRNVYTQPGDAAITRNPARGNYPRARPQ